MAKKLVPSEFKTHLISQMLESVTEPANTAYYAFIGDHVSEGATEEEVNPPIESFRKQTVETYKNLILGKRITSADLQYLVPRHDWESGTVYEMYDDETIDILNKNFFVVVDEESYKHVYKCLYNADGAPSTAKPLFRDARYDADLFTSGDDYYETNDGYQWKYMYSINSTVFTKFATQKYIPVTANTVIEQNANPGSIDVIRVINPGKNYTNYTSGQFDVADLQRTDRREYRVTRTRTATDFFANTIMYISSGTAAGEYSRIASSYYSYEDSGTYVVLDQTFDFSIPLDPSSKYEISPEVKITGDGQETEFAIARTIIDPDASDSIKRIEMLDTGKNYSFATAAISTGVLAEADGSPIQVSTAQVRPIVSPQGGHGANAAIEFGSTRLCFYQKFNRGEAGTVVPTNTFGQFGIIRDPLFANVAIFYDDVTGNFIENEEFIQFDKLRIAGNFQANVGAQYIKLTDPGDAGINSATDFGNHLKVGEKLYITTGNDTVHDLVTVRAGSNSTAITINEELTFDSNITQVYKMNEIGTGVIANVNTPFADPKSFLANKVSPNIVTDKQIVSTITKTSAIIRGIDLNNRSNGANTAAYNFKVFTQMYKVVGASINETLYQDETVYQGSSLQTATMTATIHSIDIVSPTQTILYLTNVVGLINTTEPINGTITNGSRLNISTGNTLDVFYGDIDPGSGNIIYLQNDIPVLRDENQSEEVRVILEF